MAEACQVLRFRDPLNLVMFLWKQVFWATAKSGIMNLSFSGVMRYVPMPLSVTWLSGSALSFMCGHDRDVINVRSELEMSLWKYCRRKSRVRLACRSFGVY